MGKYFQDTARHVKAQDFLELKQGTMTVMDYVARFTELARFSNDYVATNIAKVGRFENGLKLSIRGRIVGLRLQDMDSDSDSDNLFSGQPSDVYQLGRLRRLIFYMDYPPIL